MVRLGKGNEMTDEYMDMPYLTYLIKLGLLDHANIYVSRKLYFHRKTPTGQPFYISWKRPNKEYNSGYWLHYD